MRVVEQEIARAPQDIDVRAWRARVLAWSGRLPEAEKEYLEILKVSRTDPDNWLGLASVYLREGKLAEAQRAISTAGSFTRRQSKWGALTVGGAIGHDNAVIPKSEAFFDLDHGWKTGESGFVRGVEFSYAQHWYWYQSARILTLSGTTLVYLPGDWTFSLRAAGARSAFTGTNSEWKPSGIGRD